MHAAKTYQSTPIIKQIVSYCKENHNYIKINLREIISKLLHIHSAPVCKSIFAIFQNELKTEFFTSFTNHLVTSTSL